MLRRVTLLAVCFCAASAAAAAPPFGFGTTPTPADGLDPAGPYAEYPCAVKCGVDLYGITDIGTYHDATMLGQTFAEAPELYRRASPVTYARSNSPPTPAAAAPPPS